MGYWGVCTMYIPFGRIERSVAEDFEELLTEQIEQARESLGEVRLTPESCSVIRDGFKVQRPSLAAIVSLQELYAQLMGTSVVKRTARIARVFPNAAIVDAYEAASEVMDVDAGNLVEILITTYGNGMIHALPLWGDKQKGVVDLSDSQSVVPFLEQPILPYDLTFFNTRCKQDPFSLYAHFIRVGRAPDDDPLELGHETKRVERLVTDIRYKAEAGGLSVLLSQLGIGPEWNYEILSSWKYAPCTLQSADKALSPLKKEVLLTLNLYDQSMKLDCRFTTEGKLAEISSSPLNAGEAALPSQLVDVSIEGVCSDAWGAHCFPSIGKLESRRRSESSSNPLEAYQLLDTYFPGIRDKNVDWDATLKNIVAGNSTVLAYAGE